MVTLAAIFASPGKSIIQIDSSRQAIRGRLLAESRYIQTPNFIRCHDGDLRLLFDQYDERFFAGLLRESLRREASLPIPLQFTGRLRSAGGRTIRTRDRRTGAIRFAIQISQNVLFENFGAGEEAAVVVGLPCSDRLDALMRVMEHELLHLAEFLAFGQSSCARSRFQRASRTLFGHTAHQHAMITRRQRTIASTSFRPGHRVRFEYDGTAMQGIINRINTRATVLVEHPRGTRYTNGKRYLKFYIPMARLAPA